MNMRHHAIRVTAPFVLAIGLHPVLANAQYDAPTSYYSGATGTGSTLKSQLRTIISSGAIDRSYDAARQALAITDRDSNNASNVLLMYNRASVSSTWDSGNTWNREHIWPQSLLNGADDSDLFNLRPANPSINSSRGNKPFGISSTALGTSHGATGGSTYYYPGDPDRGDAARSLFYMATRYSSNLTLVNGSPSAGQMGDLASLLKWHYEDVPDTFERRRNHVIYSSTESPSYFQNNRNPYVDRPEYVWSVFGDNANDSKLYVSAAAPGNGTSSATLDLGRVLRNAAAPAAKTVTLQKAGADPTYFEVSASGNATSSVNGRSAFGYNPQSRSLSLGLNAGTASTGLKTGSITINNLDISTAGTGTGSGDGDDTVTVQYAVVEKRQVQSVGTVSLGRVLVNADLAATSTLQTSGTDAERTRVNVALTASADANGVRVSGGTGTLFNGSTSTGSRTLAARFTSPGHKSGVRPLAVTTAENAGAGIGEGAYAASNIAYTALALAHATPSFSSSGAQSALTLNFGTVARNSADPVLGFSITNLESFADFTAGLELDSIEGPTESLPFSHNLAVFGGTSMIDAGESLAFSAVLDTAFVGDFTGEYLLRLSDENLPGEATNQTLRLTLHGNVVVPEPHLLGLLSFSALLLRRRA